MNVAGDSPELIAGAYSLGIVHSPGYPLYTLLGYLFTHIPIGSVAFRLNFASSLFHSLALLLLYISFVKLTGNRAASAIATAALGLSSLFWFYSLVAEVFPLNDLFAAALILNSIVVRERWVGGDRNGSRRSLLLLAFLCGLSLSHHQTIVLIFPSLLLFTLYPLFSLIKKPRWLGLATLLFMAGVLPYLYLPIRAAQNPYMNFGDPSTLKNFLYTVLRRYYGGSRLWIGPAAESRLDLVFDFLKALGREVSIYGLLLGILGMFAMARKRPGDFFPLFTGFLLAGVVFNLMANVKLRNSVDISTIERFYLLPIILFAFFIAAGAGVVIGWLRTLLARIHIREDLKRSLAWVIVLLIALPFLLPARTTSADVNLKYDVIGENYIKNLLASLEEGAVVFTQGDIPFELMQYHMSASEAKKSVFPIIYPYLLQSWYWKTLALHYPGLRLPSQEDMSVAAGSEAGLFRAWFVDYLIANNPQVPAFYIITRERELQEHFQLIPQGIAYEILPLGQEIDLGAYLQRQRDYWKRFDCRGLDVSFYAENRSEFELTRFIAHYPQQAGFFVAERGDAAAAEFFFLQASLIAPP